MEESELFYILPQDMQEFNRVVLDNGKIVIGNILLVIVCRGH